MPRLIGHVKFRPLPIRYRLPTLPSLIPMLYRRLIGRATAYRRATTAFHLPVAFTNIDVSPACLIPYQSRCHVAQHVTTHSPLFHHRFVAHTSMSE